ncbi:glycosyltransferase [Fictibacillus nanhaiensis]|uniref:glycosyltransferase n=1 Tax=Fictibacillus nanhaiensis TaxID=742169 RepID=UPI001C964BD7|nr:glycosyltransferase [Fictibacillus nanhaiensis]MBY6037227.1 glycosyltransferase [Fictibacillus nanhaiensis]
MKILYITPRLPFPPTKGDQLRSYNQLKGLKRLGHDIHLISFSNNKTIPYELELLCKNISVVPLNKLEAIKNFLLSLYKRMPLQVSLYLSKEFEQTIHKAIQMNKYDIVHNQLVRTLPYYSVIKDIPNVMDFVDSISLNLNRRIALKKSFLNMLFKYEASKIYEMEKQAASCYDGGIFISDVDKGTIDANNDAVTTIPNGVDINYFTYHPQLTEENTLIFVGNMSYEPNREAVKYFVTKIFPLIESEIDNLTFYIVGRKPTKDLIRLCKKHKNIIITGEVPDIRDYLAKAKLFVCPMQSGAGLQNKVLEAMAAGIPVITTPIVNEPIKAVNHKTILVRDGETDFAKGMIEILSNDSKLEEIRHAAREFIEMNYQWHHLHHQLEKFYVNTINRLSMTRT